MEPIAIYILFAVGITVLVAWAVSYSTSTRRHYDRDSPPYGYPYPPPYPYPPQGDSSGMILALAFLGFLLFAGMKYYDRMERDKWPVEDNNGLVEDTTSKTQDVGEGTGRIEDSPPPTYDKTLPPIAPPPPPVPTQAPAAKPLAEQFFVQLHASGSDQDILDAARKYLADYPGRVWIGDKASDVNGRFKILIGPYDTRAAAKAVHGSRAWVRVPGSGGITLYRPE